MKINSKIGFNIIISRSTIVFVGPMVVDRFRKMCILMLCKKTMKGQDEKNMLLERERVKFGMPRRIISYGDTIFLIAFWTILWENKTPS